MAWVAAKRNIIVLDGDQAGHQALKQSVVKEQIRQRFGSDVFNADGEVNRKKLAEKVFGSSAEQQQARQAVLPLTQLVPQHGRVTQPKAQLLNQRSFRVSYQHFH